HLSHPGAANSSISGGEQTFKMEFLILQLLTAIIALVKLAVNGVVLWLDLQIHRNAFSIYILNLAGANFLLLCSYRALETLIRNFYLISIFIPHFFMTVAVFAYTSGLSFLSVINTESCLSIQWPIWYHSYLCRHLSALTFALLWALSLLLSILDIHHVCCPVMDFINVAWLILLFVLLSGSSLALMIRVQLTRLYVTFVLMVLVFLFCGLPFSINWFLLKISMPSFLISWRQFSCPVSTAGPTPSFTFFVGSFRQRWWKQRHPLRLVLQRALQDTPEVDEPGESLRGETLDMLE
uniref:G-protein coupled receptors family 1 profile domain-containing protein n=1 Tax=Myotis lucifugus TaxID=59463 RepID=G1PYS6_MYOLU